MLATYYSIPYYEPILHAEAHNWGEGWREWMKGNTIQMEPRAAIIQDDM